MASLKMSTTMVNDDVEQAEMMLKMAKLKKELYTAKKVADKNQKIADQTNESVNVLLMQLNQMERSNGSGETKENTFTSSSSRCKLSDVSRSGNHCFTTFFFYTT